MSPPSLRTVADALGLSTATVSRALHGDPAVRPETARRVLEKVEALGYRIDPTVSAGMSKIRQRDFYRATLAWCGDREPLSLSWMNALFEGIEVYGARLGYRIESFRVDPDDPKAPGRLAKVWRARGIAGVILGPFRDFHPDLTFPWDRLAWVAIGELASHLPVHLVGRDYDDDLRKGLAWLEEKGAQRPVFLAEPRSLFSETFLRAALRFYFGKKGAPPEPFVETNASFLENVDPWLKTNRPDALVIPGTLPSPIAKAFQQWGRFPVVSLSPISEAGWGPVLATKARYRELGHSSVNLLHRLLVNRETGLPTYRQKVVISSERLPHVVPSNTAA